MVGMLAVLAGCSAGQRAEKSVDKLVELVDLLAVLREEKSVDH